MKHLPSGQKMSMTHYMSPLLIRIAAVLFSMLAASPSPAAAATCDVPDGLALKRPSDGPTEVSFRVILIDLHAIRETSQTFAADLMAVGSWYDPRLAARTLGHSLEGCLVAPDRIWTPRALVLNLRSADYPLSEIEVDRDGNVVRRTRMIGEFGMQMNLRDFPFDQQTLGITVASIYGPDEVAFRADEDDMLRFSGITIPGWQSIPGSTSVSLSPVQLPGRNQRAAGLKISASVIRETSFHLWKLVFPLTTIVFMAWGVFWIDPSNLNPQVGLSSSAALTFVAFQLGLSDLLPPIDYLTRADRFILGSQLLVFLALAEAITSARLFSIGRKELARNLDRWSRRAYLVVFFLVLCVSFWI